MTHATIGHRDYCIISGLQHQPNIERRAAVGADRLPVASSIDHLPGQPFSLKRTARHQTNAAGWAGDRWATGEAVADGGASRDRAETT